MPVREQRQIAGRERRLGAGQRVESNFGIGEDLRAVALRNGVILVGALGLLAAFQPSCSRRTDLVLRLEPDALRFVAAMVDARFDAE